MPKFISRKQYCYLIADGKTVYFTLALHRGVLRILLSTYDPKENRWFNDDYGMKVMDELPKNLKGYGEKTIDTLTQSQIKRKIFSDGELDQIFASNLDQWAAGLAHELIQGLEIATEKV